jgi:hypothetical protein
MWKRFIPWTTELAGQLLLPNYHIINVKLFGMLKLNYNILLDRFKNKHFQYFSDKMLTGTVVLLALLGGTVALLVILKCIGCIQHLHLKWTTRRHPGPEKDTIKYKSSGMLLDFCCCLFWKLPVDICSWMCCPPEDIIIHV